MAYINLSDITGVPVLMPVFREITPSITFENSAGLTPDISALKFYRIGRKLFVTGQVSFVGNGTDTGTFRINIGLTSKGYAQSSSVTLFKAGTSAGGPGNITMAPSSSYLYFKKDDSTTVSDIAGNLLGANTGRFVIVRGSAFFDIEGWDEYEAIGTGVATADRAGLVSRAVFSQLLTTLTGATTAPAIGIDQSKINNSVTIRISATGNVTKNAAAGSYSFAHALESDFRPANTMYFPVLTANGVVMLRIQSNGVIDIFQSATGTNIPAGNTSSGWGAAMAVSYTIS